MGGGDVYQTSLDRAIGHYLVDSGSSWADVAGFLGITPKALRLKRTGRTSFTARETRSLADLLDTSMDEVYALLPEQPH